MEARDRYDGLPRSLSAASFTILGRQFAAHSATCGALTWAWIDAASIDGGPFGSPPTGYLRASPLLLQTPERGHDAAMAAALDNADDDPSLAAPILSQAPRLLLQIVHNTTYNVPVLLLQGYHAEGSLWSPDELRAHLTAIPGVAPPLTPSMITQMEHPALRTPFCCVDPCRTAMLMGHMLPPKGTAEGTAEGIAEGGGTPTLDYLSAWWSVLAPLVGARSRAVWYRDEVHVSRPVRLLSASVQAVDAAAPPVADAAAPAAAAGALAAAIGGEPPLPPSPAALAPAPSADDEPPPAPQRDGQQVWLVGLRSAAHNGQHAVVCEPVPPPGERHVVRVLGRGDGGPQELKVNPQDLEPISLFQLPSEVVHRILIEAAGKGGTPAAFRPLSRLAQTCGAARAAVKEVWPSLMLSLLPRGTLALPRRRVGALAGAASAEEAEVSTEARAEWRHAGAATILQQDRSSAALACRAAAALVPLMRGGGACEPRWQLANWTLPVALYGHTSVVWRGQLVVFGGRAAGGVHTNAVHVAELTKSPPVWSQPTTAGVLPCYRRLHTATLDPHSGRLHVLGGSLSLHTIPEAACGDAHTLCLAGWSWHALPAPPPRAPSEEAYGRLIGRYLPGVPPPRDWAFFAHSSTYLDPEMLMTATGSLASPASPAATAASSAPVLSCTRMLCPKGCLLVFGGLRMSMGIPARVSAAHEAQVVQMGGLVLPIESHELLRYCLSTSEWAGVQTAGKRPTAAFRHSATLVPQRSQLVFWGGFAWHSLDREPWTDDLPCNTLTVLGLGAHSAFMTWSQPEVAQRACWALPRGSHSATLLGDQIIIFGGVSLPEDRLVNEAIFERDLDDAFVIDTTTWQLHTTATLGCNAPAVRSAHSAHVVPSRYVDGNVMGDGDGAAPALALLVIGGREFIAAANPEDDEHHPRDSVHALMLWPLSAADP